MSPEHKFDDLFRLVCDPNLLTQAMGNLKEKKGALTPGPSIDPTTIDATSLTTIDNLSKSLKDGTFHFKPVRRIFIDKTGKNPKIDKDIQKLYKQKLLTPTKIKELKIRPLGIPSFNDKIVQEAIRMILNSIYEPEFEKTNYNFGFRPRIGVHDALRSIQQYSKAMTFAIEADIQGAFDNIDFDTLMTILKKKIKDRKFLKLILYSLKCGINYSEQFEETKIGTTQGSIVSPILYNIYFHEFDNYIKNEFTQIVHQINIKRAVCIIMCTYSSGTRDSLCRGFLSFIHFNDERYKERVDNRNFLNVIL
jgi:retron-type reverse transcriptase